MQEAKTGIKFTLTIKLEIRKYNNFAAYGEAKVVCMQYALELAERLKEDDVTTFSIHPGWEKIKFWQEVHSWMQRLLC